MIKKYLLGVYMYQTHSPHKTICVALPVIKYWVGRTVHRSGRGPVPHTKLRMCNSTNQSHSIKRKKSQRGVGLKRVYILSSGTVFCFNSHGLFLGKVPDLEKIHSKYSRERKKNKQAKNTLMWLEKNLRTWCWWERTLKLCVRPTQVLLMFDQLLSYYSSCYRCSCNLCNRMFKKIKEKLQEGSEVIRVPKICIYERLEYKFLYSLRINHPFVFLFS